MKDARSIGRPSRKRQSAHSDRIPDASSELGARSTTRLVDEGVPDADLIYSIVPDHRDIRTMIVISAMSLPLLEALAQRFPPDAVAVQVDATRGPLEY